MTWDFASDEIRVEYLAYSSKLFGMVGGIALLTLIINGTSSGPLLKKLGLVTPSETRMKVCECKLLQCSFKASGIGIGTQFKQYLPHATVKNYRRQMVKFTLM